MTEWGEKLAEPFSQASLSYHKNKRITYVSVSEVVARLNRVIGTGNWGFEIIRMWEAGEQKTNQAGTLPRWVMAHVRLSGHGKDGYPFSIDGVGGHAVELFQNKNDAVDLGDSYKAAMSDALKKAAQHLGVGLDLARQQEAIAIERQVMEAEADAVSIEGFGSKDEAKKVTDELKERVEGLPDTQQQRFLAWKADQSFPWPWPKAACDAISGELDRLEAELEEVF